MAPVINLSARIGASRDVEYAVDELLRSMEENAIDRVLVSPSDGQVAHYNAEGNQAVARAAADSGGRLLAYAVATPWLRPTEALDLLEQARDLGAVALYFDPEVQGFDPMDGMWDPLLDFAKDAGWFVYVRTGTPPHATPLIMASVARRHPELHFVMGRSGATDFWTDVMDALLYAPNLYGETVNNGWEGLAGISAVPGLSSSRFVFGCDLPYNSHKFELMRMHEWPLTDAERAAVLGGTVAGWLGL